MKIGKTDNIVGYRFNKVKGGWYEVFYGWDSRKLGFDVDISVSRYLYADYFINILRSIYNDVYGFGAKIIVYTDLEDEDMEKVFKKVEDLDVLVIKEVEPHGYC